MAPTRCVVRSAFLIAVVVVASVVGSAAAAATELGDYLWERRPLLVFAPTNDDPRLVDTLSRIQATRCEFVDREMVLGVVVAQGTSTLDGHLMSADEALGLANRYAVDASAFTAVLIGKDGGEKLRVNRVPELSTIYAVVDGMPMRSREASANPGRC